MYYQWDEINCLTCGAVQYALEVEVARERNRERYRRATPSADAIPYGGRSPGLADFTMIVRWERSRTRSRFGGITPRPECPWCAAPMSRDAQRQSRQRKSQTTPTHMFACPNAHRVWIEEAADGNFAYWR